jgi:hypothetical protein
LSSCCSLSLRCCAPCAGSAGPARKGAVGGVPGAGPDVH